MCGGREEGEGGGGGGGRTAAAAAAAASPRRQPQDRRLPGPPLQQRRGPSDPGPAAAAAASAIEGDAPRVFILVRPRRRAARGELQRPGRRAGCARRTAPPGWSWRAVGKRSGWLGSGPRSARGLLPLPPAHSSSELHRRPSPAPWVSGWTGGRGRVRQQRASRLRTSFPDFAERASSRRSQLSERDFLSAPSRSRWCHRPFFVPPRAPRPSPPLLSAPAPGWPRGGSVPERDIDSCRSPCGPGPRSPGCLPS